MLHMTIAESRIQYRAYGSLYTEWRGTGRQDLTLRQIALVGFPSYNQLLADMFIVYEHAARADRI